MSGAVRLRTGSELDVRGNGRGAFPMSRLWIRFARWVETSAMCFSRLIFILNEIAAALSRAMSDDALVDAAADSQPRSGSTIAEGSTISREWSSITKPLRQTDS